MSNEEVNTSSLDRLVVLTGEFKDILRRLIGVTNWLEKERTGSSPNRLVCVEVASDVSDIMLSPDLAMPLLESLTEVMERRLHTLSTEINELTKPIE